MASLRKKINAKCKDCIYDSAVEGTWLDQVTMCTSTECPLWPVRPKVRRPDPRRRQKLVRLMREARVSQPIRVRCLGENNQENGPHLGAGGQSDVR